MDKSLLSSVHGEHQPKTKARALQEHLPFLDALRGLAILGVLIVHCITRSGMSGQWQAYGLVGERGVQLFYVVSAFSLYHSHTVRSKNELYPLNNYFIRRFFRIAPLFYLAAIGNLLLNGLGPRPAAPGGLTAWEVAGGFLFLFGLHPNTINSFAMGGWSVAVESSFYLILPLLLRFVTSLRRALITLLVSAFTAPVVSTFCLGFIRSGQWTGNFTRSFFASDDWGTFLFHNWFLIEFPVFCMGIFAYYICQRFTIRPRRSKFFSLALVFTATLVFWLNLPCTSYALYPISCAFIPLIVGLYFYEWPLLVSRPLIFLGKISYSVYLTHFFFLFFSDSIMATSSWPWNMCTAGSVSYLLVFFISITIPSVIISVGTYMFIEKPGIRLGALIIKMREKQTHLNRL